MNNKKTILHIIQNFGKGGAETTVVGVLKNLSEYNNIVVTLDGFNEFGDELKYDKYYCLNLKSYYFSLLAIKKLRKIIIDNKVDLVHSQLYWSTILARFACPPSIPLLNSIQASLTESVEYKKGWIGWLDKFSYNKRDCSIIGVSKHTLDDYFGFLKLKRHRNYVLYNFVDTTSFPFQKLTARTKTENFKLVTVGSLKPQKNQRYLLEALKRLKGKNVSLDIYGEGMLRKELTAFIEENQLPVLLMGQVDNLNEVIGNYDLFVMSSLYEGFSLAVLEGMLMERPMLLPEISTFTEQCANTAVYFSLDDVDDFVEKTVLLMNDQERLNKMSLAGKQRVLSHFTLEHHMACLRKIYLELLTDK